jgi:hypothetical protein
MWVACCIRYPSLWAPTSISGLVLQLLTASEGLGAAAVRTEARQYIHALCAITEPDSKASATASGATHPHPFILQLLLAELVVAPGAVPRAPLKNSAECYTLASQLLSEACGGRCGLSPAHFRKVLESLLQFIVTSPIVETKAVGGTVDRELAGSMELASVLVCCGCWC